MEPSLFSGAPVVARRATGGKGRSCRRESDRHPDPPTRAREGGEVLTAKCAPLRRIESPTPTLPRTGGGRRGPQSGLLNFDSGAGVLELLGHGLSFLSVDAFLDRLGRLVNQVLGLFQAEAGDLPDDLDDADLGVAGPGQDDVELRLLRLGGGRGCPAGDGRRCHGHGSGSRYAVLLLDGLDRVHHVDHGPLLQGRYEVVDSYLCYDSSLIRRPAPARWPAVPPSLSGSEARRGFGRAGRWGPAARWPGCRAGPASPRAGG